MVEIQGSGKLRGSRMRSDSGALAILLVIVAVAMAGLAVLFLSQATAGVGLVGGGCLIGILARMAQASAHQGEIARWHNERE